VRKLRGTKPVASTPVPRNAGSQAKSQRRIFRVVSHWSDVSAIVAAGGKPDEDDIAFLLRLGEPVPPDVQAYLADLVDAPRKAKGRPAKHPGQLEYDQLRKAGDLFAAIRKIRAEGRLSEAMACKEYAKTNRLSRESVERQYRAAKKKLRAAFERVDGDPKCFLTYEDYIAWEKASLKKCSEK
jgi:hypothetical protein